MQSLWSRQAQHVAPPDQRAARQCCSDRLLLLRPLLLLLLLLQLAHILITFLPFMPPSSWCTHVLLLVLQTNPGLHWPANRRA